MSSAVHRAFFFVFIIAVSTLYAGDKDISKIHTKIYKDVSPSVVGVTFGTQQRGTGVIIDEGGIILTSTTSTGLNNNAVYVYIRGHKKYKGEVIKVVKSKDLVLLKIDAKDLTAIELGDSDKVKLGQISYVLGDSFNSIFTDDQVTMSMGVISSFYELRETKARDSAYKGKVIETSAAINPNSSGAPLVNVDGELVGLASLNYNTSRFTGLAIPINELKPFLKRPTTPTNSLSQLGLELEDAKDGIEIMDVFTDSVSAKAGLKRSDIITSINDEKVGSGKELTNKFTEAKAKTDHKIKILRNGKEIEIHITSEDKGSY
ncbi:MAG: hypothetical protein A2W23_05940 [Planctomycetes bacterium RBG_16_43_13]|nr:MAG: hypothetical protein A2W23_05940 [Planctomycetes bacterium RBG_16_43_13]